MFLFGEQRGLAIAHVTALIPVNGWGFGLLLGDLRAALFSSGSPHTPLRLLRRDVAPRTLPSTAPSALPRALPRVVACLADVSALDCFEEGTLEGWKDT